MKMLKTIRFVCCMVLLCTMTSLCAGQTARDTLSSISAIKVRDITRLGDQYDHLSVTVEKKTNRFLRQVQTLQSRLQSTIACRDSVSGGLFQRELTAVNTQLTGVLSICSSAAKNYLPGIDSIQTAILFWQSCAASSSQILHSQLQRLQSLDQRLSNLQNQLGRAESIADLAAQYQQEWMGKWQSYSIASRMASLQKQVYYYKEQLQQYQSMLHDPDKLASRVLGAVRNSAAFQQYMQQHSTFSRLFNVPGSQPGSNVQGAAGLQTREQVSAQLSAKMGQGASLTTGPAGSGANAAVGGDGNPLSTGMKDAQAEITQLKSKLSSFGQGNSNATMPDFQPNSQHNKTLFQRLQIGFNIQSTASTVLLPAYSEIALTIGYRTSDRFVTGIGISYNLGWGQPFGHIALSSQGAGVRYYLNWRFSNSWWISGGLEGNYLNAFNSTVQLRDLNAWQTSALGGIMKTYKAGRKQGNIQLLYDFLHAEHVPPSPAFIFRVGYSLH